MKIALIVAMQKELNLLLEHIGTYSVSLIDNIKLYRGRIGEHDILLCQSGIGKVNSAIRTSHIIDQFQPELVINSGVAGGLDASMHIGSVLVAEKISYHDVWCGPGTTYGQADGCPSMFDSYPKGLDILRQIKAESSLDIEFGLICSGDKFISTSQEVSEIKLHFPKALGCDMESAAIAQTCFMANVPVLVVRVMSDTPGAGENISQYQNFWSDAPARTFSIIRELINRI